MAEAFLCACGNFWGDEMNPVATRVVSCERCAPLLKDLVNKIVAAIDADETNFTGWERNLVYDIQCQFEADRPLSEKQLQALRGINNRMTGKGSDR